VAPTSCLRRGAEGPKRRALHRLRAVHGCWRAVRDRHHASGVKPPRFGIPLLAMYLMGYLGDVARIALRRDIVLSSRSVRLMHIWPTLDHGKAERELGWQPEPVHDAVRGPRSSFGRIDADSGRRGEKQVAHYACPRRVPA